jgi:hypothetical protein
MCPDTGLAGFYQQGAGDLASGPDEAQQVGERFSCDSRAFFELPQPARDTADQISREEPTTQVEAEGAVPDVTGDVAPQTPDVAPEAAHSNVRATRAKKAPKGDNGGAPREGSKTSQVIAMLKREGGTTLEEIMTAMGWQKHTTRAMLSAGGSLTKNHGLTVISEKVGEHRRYSIKG